MALSYFARAEESEKTPEQLQQLIEMMADTPIPITPRPTLRIHKVERRIGQEQVGALLARYNEGASAKTVAAEFEVSISSVTRLVQKHGGRMRGKPLDDVTVARAAALYATGLSVQHVARELSIPKTSLLRAMKEAEVPLRAPKH